MDDLREAVRQFAEARDWEKFHSPKNLAMGVAAESGELLEIFLWLSESESKNLDETQLANLKEEIGDIVIYLDLSGEPV